MSKNYTTYATSPLGTLQITAEENRLTAINYNDNPPTKSPNEHPHSVLTKTVDQLNEYFDGQRKTFDLPLILKGTDFQQKVWKQLQQIPYGQTITYSELAKRLGDLQKARAVAGANGMNPLPIIIPCHRVIGANNKLTGYSGGIQRKEFLLKLEGALLL